MKRRGVLTGLSAAFSLLVLLVGAVGLAVLHPKTPLPTEWNPTTALDVMAPPTPVTFWKLRQQSEGASCLAALRTSGAVFTAMPDLVEGARCGIRDRILLRSVAGVSMDPVETKCATALRLALWTEHGLKPAAQAEMGSDLTKLQHFSSYNCRAVRTVSGTSARMSTHATAEAIDIAGFTLADGRRITLLGDWGHGQAGDFLAEGFSSACRWFVTTLGPDYNALHADHFHLQSRGWGLCR